MHLRNVNNDETTQVKRCFECPFTCTSAYHTMSSLLHHCEEEHEHSLGKTIF